MLCPHLWPDAKSRATCYCVGYGKQSSHPAFWMVSQCSWFLANEKCFQGQDLWWGGRGRRESEVNTADTVEKAAWEGPWISGSSPSFPSCSPGPGARVSSSCVRNQDSLEQFMLQIYTDSPGQYPHLPSQYLKVTCAASSTLDNCSKGSEGVVYKWINSPSINTTQNEPFNDRQVCMALPECYHKI